MDTQDRRTKVYEMLGRFETTVLVTTNDDGQIDANPMRVADVDGDGAIWFLSARDARRIANIRDNAQALLVFQDDQRQYLTVRGMARVERTRGRVRELWHESHRVWFPEGPDAPDLALIVVEPHAAEFWDYTGASRLRYLWEAARAYTAGERPTLTDAEHGQGRL